jgi:hypothetical protein
VRSVIRWASICTAEKTICSFLSKETSSSESLGTDNSWLGKVAPLLGYAFPNVRFHPALSVRGAVSSGDRNPADADLETFNPLFPNGLYYGYMDFVSGSLNAVVVRPMVSLQLSKSVPLTGDSFVF